MLSAINTEPPANLKANVKIKDIKKKTEQRNCVTKRATPYSCLSRKLATKQKVHGRICVYVLPASAPGDVLFFSRTAKALSAITWPLIGLPFFSCHNFDQSYPSWQKNILNCMYKRLSSGQSPASKGGPGIAVIVTKNIALLCSRQ